MVFGMVVADALALYALFGGTTLHEILSPSLLPQCFSSFSEKVIMSGNRREESNSHKERLC